MAELPSSNLVSQLRAALELASKHAVPSTHYSDQYLISAWVLGELERALALPVETGCFTETQVREFCGYVTGYLTELHETHPGSVWDAWQSYLKQPAPKAPDEPKPCEHLRSDLLAVAEKPTTGEVKFEMRKCLDCKLIFRVRSSLKTSAVNPTHQHAEGCPKLFSGECACDPVPL